MNYPLHISQSPRILFLNIIFGRDQSSYEFKLATKVGLNKTFTENRILYLQNKLKTGKNPIGSKEVKVSNFNEVVSNFNSWTNINEKFEKPRVFRLPTFCRIYLIFWNMDSPQGTQRSSWCLWNVILEKWTGNIIHIIGNTYNWEN